MSGLNSTTEVKVSVNGKEAKEELKNLEKIAKGLRAQLADAVSGKDVPEQKRLQRDLNKTNREIQKMRRESLNVREAMLSLDSASPNELRRTLRSITQQMNSGSVKRGSKEWEEYSQMAGKVRRELSNIYKEQRIAEPMLTRLAGNAKRVMGSWVGQIAAITGVTVGIRESINAYTSLNESQADVIKYTDLTTAEVEQLQARLKEIDTRTAREQLNALAGDAGRLGISGIDAINDFVYAADVLNLALGEDLGEEGVKNIGKLALMFGEDERLGLREAMLGTGSAINELAQSSSASEPYLVNFTARMGGVANQANIAQTNIMGYASVLDQNMQSLEKSSTALSNIILRMTRDPQKYAQIAGASVQEFTNLLKTDANEALIQFLEGMGRLGDLTEISPVLKDLQLTGDGVSSTVSVLAANIDVLRQEQDLANKSYNEANSVIEEANIKNNTALAILEKKKKAFREESAELGERLIPIQYATIDGSKQMLRVGVAIIEFLYRNRRLLISLIATIVTYNLTLKASIMWATASKSASLLLASGYSLLTGNIKRARVAMQAFIRTSKAHPFAAILSIVVALGGALWVASQRLSGVEKAARSLNKIKAKAANSAVSEKAQLESLLKIARSETESKEARRKAIEEINRISPEYLGHLDLETIKTDKAKESIDNYIESIEDMTKKRVLLSRLEDIAKERYQGVQNLRETQKKWYMSLVPKMFRPLIMQHQIKNLQTDTGDLDAEEKMLLAELDKQNKKTSNKVKPKGDNQLPLTPIIPDNDNSDVLKKKEAELDKWLSIEKAKLAGHYANGLIDKAEYDNNIKDLDIDLIKKRLELYEQGTKEYADLEASLLLKQKEISEQSVNQSRESILQEFQEEQRIAKNNYAEGNITFESYKQQMLDLELQCLKKTAMTHAEGTKERIDLERKYEDLLLKDKLEKREAHEKLKKSLLQKYSQNTASEQYNLEIQALENLHADKLLSEEEFLKAKKDLESRYKQDVASNFLESEEGQAMIDRTQFALSSIQTIMSGFNNFVMAESDAEVAKIDRKYEAEIRAAGNNQYKLRQIEEKKQKEVAAVKAKYADKALTLQMAIAMAQAVQGSINAYTSTAAIPIVGPSLAPIAAGIAMAAGMLNIAAIKKQHAAAKKGFYDGGYTGPGRWDEEKGVVHADEFVANRHAVNNPAVRPVLDFIDAAQKNNTIGSITADDISQRLYPVQSSNNLSRSSIGDDTTDQVESTLLLVNHTLLKLESRLNKPFHTINTVDGEYGMKQAFDKFNQQEKNKSR